MATSHKYFVFTFFAICLTIPLLDTFAKYLLNIDFFAFRAWEVVTQNRIEGPFASSVTFEKNTYGDLANMLSVTKYKKFKNQKFSTDSFGFRNAEQPKDIYYPVVVLGDSNMAGSSLSNDQTFDIKLGQILGLPIYNYATFTPDKFLDDERFMHQPPKLVIWETIERTILGGGYRKNQNIINQHNFKLNTLRKPENQNTDIPKVSSFFSRKIFYEFRWYFTKIKPDTIAYIDEKSEMLFYKPGVDLLNTTSNDRDIASVIAGIKRVHDLFLERGIVLIFMALPDKENIYKSFLPPHLSQIKGDSVFLRDLEKGLTENGIYNVDIYSAFEKVSDSNEFMYYEDDTHWNPKGVNVAAEEVKKYIIKKNLSTRLHE